jgi:hypothetical protein
VIVSFAGTLVLYEFLVRRFRVMRFLFGMKRLTQSSPARARVTPSLDTASRVASKTFGIEDS